MRTGKRRCGITLESSEYNFDVYFVTLVYFCLFSPFCVTPAMKNNICKICGPCVAESNDALGHVVCTSPAFSFFLILSVWKCIGRECK